MNVYQYKPQDESEHNLIFYFYYSSQERTTYIYGPANISLKQYHKSLLFYVENCLPNTYQITDGIFRTEYYPFHNQPSLDDVVREISKQFPREAGLSDLLIPDIPNMSLDEFNEWYANNFPYGAKEQEEEFNKYYDEWEEQKRKDGEDE